MKTSTLNIKPVINAPTRQAAREFIRKAKSKGIEGLATPYQLTKGVWCTGFKREILHLNK